MFVNQLIDNDEKLEHLCPDCRNEVTSKHRCTRCGKEIPHFNYDDSDDSFVNPDFNEEEYNAKAMM